MLPPPPALLLAADAGFSPHDLHPMPGGHSADLWRIQPAGSPDPIAVLKLQRGLPPKALAEAFALRELERAGLPQVPRVLAVRGEAACAGLVLSWIGPATPMDAALPSRSAEATARAGADLGAWLAALHSVEVPHGDVRFAADPLPWPARVGRQAEQATRRLLRQTEVPPGLPADTLEVARASASWLQAAIPRVLDDPRPGRMIHRDLRPANLLLADDGGLCGVVDFERAGAGDPAWDFVKLGWWTLDRWPALRPGVEAAYTARRALPDPERLRLYRVFEALGLLAFFIGKHPVYPAEAVAQLRAGLEGVEAVMWATPV